MGDTAHSIVSEKFVESLIQNDGYNVNLLYQHQSCITGRVL